MSYQGTQIYSCVSAYNLPGRGLPLWKFHIVLDMWLYTACVTFGTGSILYYFKTFFILGFCYARGQMPNTANLNLATRILKNMAYLKQHWRSPGHFYWSSSSQEISERGGGMKTTGMIGQIEVTENRLFYWSQTSYCSPEHTHHARCLDISEVSRG